MAKRELVLPIEVTPAREALMAACSLLKRSQIEDTLLRRPDGVLARVRRQDTVTRLSCNHPGVFTDTPETIVLDHHSCRRLLEILGFAQIDHVRFSRESWRVCQYLLHLDRVEKLGAFLTVEAEAGETSMYVYRRQTLKFLKKMGISPQEPGVDSSDNLAYTAPIVPGRSEQFEPQGI